MNRLFIACLCISILGGCVYQAEPMPQITHTSTPEIVLPKISQLPKEVVKVNSYVPRGWVPPSHLERKWTAIVIHHSGTKNGNAAIFDKWHREGNHWEGVGYDFVIGNGTNSGDGEVEVTYRWRQQKTGAHCGGTAGNWANKEAVGICLVGNFNKTAPTTKQMEAVKKLIHFLQKRYAISKGRVYGHKSTPGAGVTDCPGKRFPMSRLKSTLEF